MPSNLKGTDDKTKRQALTELKNRREKVKKVVSF